MALSDVTFIKGQGGLGRPLAGEDHISGIIFYLANVPSALSTIKTFYSLEEVEAAGLEPDFSSTTATQAVFDKNVAWYHIKEFFRVQPKGVLYAAAYAEPSAANQYPEVSLMQSAADGKIRQLAVYTTETFAMSDTEKLHDAAVSQAAAHKPLSILFAANVADVSALTDLKTNTVKGSYVSVIVGQDGNGQGNTIYNSLTTKKSVTALGAALGAVSLSKVSENIGWVKNFNMSSGELDVLAFADGTSYRSKSEGEITALHDKKYIFLRKHIGINGSYFNDSHTAITATSDYGNIENNRTIDKAIRNIRSFVLPELNGPLFVDEDGKLSEDTVAYFTSLAGRPLEQMQRDAELSAFLVTIDPTQDVLSDSTLEISVKLVPVGVARQIKVNIGFTVKIS